MSHKVSTLARAEFDVFNGSTAVTGLVNGDFTKLLSKDGADNATAVTVAEIGSGRYTVTFTPASTGVWIVTVRNATYNPEGWKIGFVVTTDGELSAADVTAAVPTVAAIWAYVVYTGYSAARLLRKIFAETAGKTAGGPTNHTSYAPDGTTAEVIGSADSNGDRTITSYES